MAAGAYWMRVRKEQTMKRTTKIPLSFSRANASRADAGSQRGRATPIQSVPRWRWRAVFRLTLCAAATLALSGCILRLMTGLAFVDDLGVFIDAAFENVSVARCTELEDFETGEVRVDCLYNIATEDGFSEITSTARLISDFGLFGVIIDPLILQVPDITTLVAATVDDGSGPQDLVVTETTAFDVQPGVQTTAEPGTKFWIVDLPAAIEATVPDGPLGSAPQYDFNFQARLPNVFSTNPVPVKAMFAGRVESGGETYYFPMLPCTTEFADVPQIELPVGFPLNGFIFNLLDLFMDNANAGCDGDAYNFTPVVQPPVACDIDGDRDVDRNDIQAIVGRRNTPAVLDDPFDVDGDGIVTVQDARRCSLDCTLPRCAIP